MKRLIWMGCWSYLLIGFAHVVVGSLLPVLLEHYGKDYSAGGSLIFTQFAGFLVGVTVSPLILSRFGKIKGLLIAVTLLCVAEAAYTLLLPWEWIYVIGIIAGFGFGMIEAVVGTMIISAIKNQTAVAMSRLEVFFGLGALLMPLIAGLMIRIGAWQYSFLFVALTAFILLMLWLKGNSSEINDLLNVKEEKNQPKIRFIEQYRGKRGALLAIFIVFFFLYVGIEMSFVNFLPSLMIEKLGITEANAAFSVTLFWVTMSVGRIFAGVIAERISYATYCVWSSFFSVVLLALFALTSGATTKFILIMLFGLSMSGLFSITLVFASKLLPGSEQSTPSLLIAAGGLGGAILPLMMGKSMDLGGPDQSAWMLAAFMLLLFILSLVVSVVRRSSSYIDVNESSSV